MGGHSGLTTHSGLQSGGDPWYPGKQEQVAKPWDDIKQRLYGPQGDGSHGFPGLPIDVGGRSRRGIKMKFMFARRLESF